MNNIKIEKMSIIKLKQVIAFHPLLDDYINDNDKEPSWDGHIYTYTHRDLKVEDIEYKVPVQVKGKNDETLIKKQMITYPVEYKHLRNYYKNDGVCYFVIVISDDGKESVIFYNAMTPIKLKGYLKNTENKKPDQTKSIPLQKLKGEESNELYKILMQYGHDSNNQGNGNTEILRKAICLPDLKDVDSIRMTAYVSSEQEILKKIKEGEICIYGHRTDFDIWLPFDYEEQKKLQIGHFREYLMPAGIDGINYYDRFRIMKEGEGNKIIQLSDNISIDIENDKFNFNPVATLPEIMKDIKFMHALEYGHELCINNKVMVTYSNVKIPDQLLKDFDKFRRIAQAFEKFDVQCSKRIEMFTQKDWKAINTLLNLEKGNIYPQKNHAWYMWWWDGKLYPIFLTKDEDGNRNAFNATVTKDCSFYALKNNKEYRVTNCILYKRDIWEKLYDVPEKVLAEQIANTEFNRYTEGNISTMFVEILAAYDLTNNEKYYNIAELLTNKLLEMSPDCELWKLNKYQLAKRKRILSEEELQDIEMILEKTDLDITKCAANILLDNKRQARKILENLSEEDQLGFKEFPIYNLL